MPTSQEKMKMTFSYNILLKTQHKGKRPLNCEYVAILVVNNNQKIQVFSFLGLVG